MGSRIVLRDLLRFGLQWSGQGQGRGQGRGRGRKTLIYGAGEAGLRLLEGLRFDVRFSVVGLLDDDPRLWGRKVQDLTIHRPDQLEAVINKQRIRQVLLAMPSTPFSRRSQLVRQLKSMGLEVMAMPSLAQIASGESAVSELRPVAIEELLGREPSEPIPELLQAAVQGEAVLVTGAGGSIGSALCRRVLSQRPNALVLLERNEFALYAIHQELQEKALAEGVELVPVLADVADQPRMEMLLRRHGITVLLHAAAYKHVPLVEANVCAGLANNIFGTRSALDSAMACGLKRFTLISTDKAVRPTNVMGASKRVCELLVQDAAVRVTEQGSGPICSMVRFGNVLGSSGSVVPLFHDQIASGGPVTVTHPEITRYFMTIPEAAQLVLQATGMAQGGEVFVLDMGEPVRLVVLARQMVELSGCKVRDDQNPDGDIAITITGLRPGEKLYEELLLSESDEPTDHPLVRKAKEQRLEAKKLTELLALLDQSLESWDHRQAVCILHELVDEYQGSPTEMSSNSSNNKALI
jgi:FlaA1/EpsC-like NDP-sugar epimerase